MSEEMDLKDRKYYMKTYNNCFLGTEAVEWMSKNLDLKKEDAIKLGQRLLYHNYIYHVARKEQFEDKEHLYKFTKSTNRINSGIFDIDRIKAGEQLFKNDDIFSVDLKNLIIKVIGNEVKQDFIKKRAYTVKKIFFFFFCKIISF